MRPTVAAATEYGCCRERAGGDLGGRAERHRSPTPTRSSSPTRGDTKLDLVSYYLSVGDAVMRQMLDRPVLLQRFPNGAHGSNFFQKRIPDGAPEWLHTTIVQTPNGTPSRALVVADLAHLVWAVNLGCLGFHSWPVRAADPDHCDELRIDLDPGPGTTYAMAQEAAAATKTLFDELGVAALHQDLGQPGAARLRASATDARQRRRAQRCRRSRPRARTPPPDLITAAWWKEQRGERIFIDFNQNAPHKTVFAPWSVRALDHAPVSFPFPWELLPTLRPHDMTIATVPRWVAEHGDAWADDERRTRNPSSRSWRWCAATRQPGCRMRPGRRCTRRWPASRRAWLPSRAKKPTEPRKAEDMTVLPIADHWFDRTTIDDSITLLWEPHVIPLMRCNIWHVRGRDRDLVVDTGMGLMSLSDEMADLVDKPVTAVATHGHDDHIGGHHEFDDVVVHRRRGPAAA